MEENEQLKLQLEKVKWGQLKAEEGRENFTQLKEAYTQLFKVYEEMQEKIKNNKVIPQMDILLYCRLACSF
ncbi:hypothetical protein GN956_G3574 [Arapaima gigas]